MALNVPDNVTQALLAAQSAWNRLGSKGDVNKVWTPEQSRQLGEITECLKNVHNALKRLIDANS